MRTISETSGTFLGDGQNPYLNVSAYLSGSSLNVVGSYSAPSLTPVSFSNAFTLPAPSTATNASVQLAANGTLTMYTGNVAPTLQTGQLVEVLALYAPSTATNFEGLTSDNEPSLD